MSAPGGCLLPGGVSAPGGGMSARGGCLLPGGVCSGGVPGGDPQGRLLLRAVRILLDCILVLYIVFRISVQMGPSPI